METLAQRIKKRYPGVYDDIEDAELERRVIAKYPGVYDDLPRTGAPMEETAHMGGIGRGPRVLGLTGRAAIAGSAPVTLATLGGDAIGTILNLGIRAYNQATGANVAEFGPQGQALERNLTAAGLPEPQTAGERITYDVNKAMVGAATSFGLASASQPATKVGELIKNVLTTAPGTQLAAAAGGGGGSSIAREMGAGPVGQFAAGLAGSIAVPVGINLAAGAGRTARALATPMGEGGREKIVGNVLRKSAQNPEETIAKLGEPPSYVPGSQPTTAQASKDYGLLITEKGLAASSPQAGAAFASRQATNNEARQILLQGIAKDKAAVDTAMAHRERLLGPLYEKAFSDFKGIPATAQEEVGTIISRLSSGAPGVLQKAKRLASLDNLDIDFAKLGQATEAPTATIAGQKISLSPEQAAQLGLTGQQGGSDALRALHYIKMALDAAINTPEPETGIDATTLHALRNVRGELIGSMQKMSPMYELAQGSWAQASQPITQMQTLQDISKRTDLAAPSLTGSPILSQAKWANVVKDNWDELSKTLTPNQLKKLQAISSDLDLGVQSQTAGKAVGSNTFQNFSIANVLGSMLQRDVKVTPLLNTLLRPLRFIYGAPDERIHELLTDAMLDPALARSLMLKASPRNVESVAFELENRARAMGIGASFATPGQQSPLPTEPERPPKGAATKPR